MLYSIKHYNKKKLETYKLSFYDSDNKALITQDDSRDGVETMWLILSSILSKESNDNVLLYRGNKRCGELSYDMIEQFKFNESKGYYTIYNNYYTMYNIANSTTSTINGVFFLSRIIRGEYYHLFLPKKDYDSISTINFYQQQSEYEASKNSIYYNSHENTLNIFCDDAFFDIVRYYQLNNKTVNIYADGTFIKHMFYSKQVPFKSNNCTLVFAYKPIDFNINEQTNAHIIFNDCKEEIYTDGNGEITKSRRLKNPLRTNHHILLAYDMKCGLYDSSSNIITFDEGLGDSFLNKILLDLPKTDVKGEAHIINQYSVFRLSYTKIKGLKIPNTYTQFNDVFGDGTCITGPTQTDSNGSIVTEAKFISSDRLQKFKIIDNGSGLNNFKITEDKLCLSDSRVLSNIIENNWINLPNLKFFIFGGYDYPRTIAGTNNCTFIYYDDDDYAYTHHRATATEELYKLPRYGNKNYRIVTIPALEMLYYINEDGLITETIIENTEYK